MSPAAKTPRRIDGAEAKIAKLEARVKARATVGQVQELEERVSGLLSTIASDHEVLSRFQRRVQKLEAQIRPHEPHWRDLIKAGEHMSTAQLQEYFGALLILAKRDP